MLHRFWNRRLFCPACALVVSLAISTASRAADEIVTVESIGGRTYTGQLAEFTDEKIVISGDTHESVPLQDVIRMDWSGKRKATLAGQNLILLANGDRLVADPVDTDGDVLNARWRAFPGFGPFRVSLELVKGLAWNLPQDPVVRAQIITRLIDHTRPADDVTLTNGNSISGEFETLADHSLTLATATGPRTIERDTLRSVAFNPELIAFPQMSGLRLIVTLIDGSRFTAQQFRYDADIGLEFVTSFQAKLTIALDRIVSLQVLGGRAVYLSDLEPQQYSFTPYLSLKWPLRRDRSVIGETLRLGKREYVKGLGTHSRAEITYALNGQYTRFQALVGIDDDAGPGGHAIAQVLVDGKPAFTSEPLVNGAPPVNTSSLDITGAETLTLIVDFGERGDVQDHVNWCDAVLVKKP